jgi:hypothetical protein
MKIALLLPLLLVVACTSPTPSVTETATAPLPEERPVKTTPPEETGIPTYCWRGNLEGNIPMQLQYQVEGDVVTGSLQYLATKKQEPITLIGSVENGEFRLLEFETNGNITGIISGKREGQTFVGDWFSPTTRKTRKMELTKVDTTLPTKSTAALPADLGGSYSYAYGAEGPQGTLTLKPLAGGKALLEISAVTGAPAFNIADIGVDTVTLEGDRIVYQFPEAPECSFQVRLYKGFAMVNYLTDGGCTSQFGHNATVEGIFLKRNK